MSATGLIIQEIYAGAGSQFSTVTVPPSTYNADYVVLYNATAAAISLDGYALQVREGGAGANTQPWTFGSLAGNTIQAYGYFLVQLTTNAATGTPPPGVDLDISTATGNRDIGPNNGRVALTFNASGTPTTLDTSDASSGTVGAETIIDYAGWGNAISYEGPTAGNAGRETGPAGNRAMSMVRDAAGGYDTNNNQSDFSVVATAAPKNSATAPDSTGAPTITNPASASVAENTTAILAITATDVETNTPFTYSIFTGAGAGADGALFSIDSAGNLSFLSAPDFETPAQAGATDNEYQLTVRVSDSGGSSSDQLVTVTVTNGNEVPDAIALSANSVQEFAAASSVIGSLSATDPEGNPLTYTLVNSAAGRFAISGSDLIVADGLLLDFEQAASHQVTVRVTDSNAGFYEQAFTIAVSNVDPESITGDANANTFVGGAGADFFDGAGGADILTGGAGNDSYVYDGLDTIIEALGGGTDTLLSASTTTLGANMENLTLTGTMVIAGTGNTLANVLDGLSNSAANLLRGLTGNDTYVVGTGDSILETATGGIDTVLSNAISLNLTAFANVERAVLAGTANLNVSGTAGANTLIGNAGNNVMIGGKGNDILTGGAGLDSFVFNSALNSTTGRDVIRDFVSADDTVRLDNAVFKALGAAGALAPAKFWASATGLAHDASDRILYNKTTGVLTYDADGNGAGAAVAFAVLGGKPVISAADFLVV